MRDLETIVKEAEKDDSDKDIYVIEYYDDMNNLWKECPCLDASDKFINLHLQYSASEHRLVIIEK